MCRDLKTDGRKTGKSAPNIQQKGRWAALRGFSKSGGSPQSSHWSNPAKPLVLATPHVRSQPHLPLPLQHPILSLFFIYELPPWNQCDLCKPTSHRCLKPLAFRQKSLLQPVYAPAPSSLLRPHLDFSQVPSSLHWVPACCPTRKNHYTLLAWSSTSPTLGGPGLLVAPLSHDREIST